MTPPSPSFDLDTVVVASETQVSADLTPGVSGELVVLDLERGVYYELNEVGAFIWRAVQEPVSVGSILEGLLNAYNVPAEECESDLSGILGKLLERGLIETRDA